MAKEPEIVERCRIHADTSLEQMGFVLAALAKMNLANIGYELITDVTTFNRKQRHDVTAEDFAAEWVKDHPTFGIKEMIAHFAAAGRDKHGAYSAAKKLIEKNVLRKLGPGNYQRADVKHIEGPKGAKGRRAANAVTRTRKLNAVARHDVTNKDVILKRIKGRSKITVKEIEDVFVSMKRNKKSVSSLFTQLSQLDPPVVTRDPNTPGLYIVNKRTKAPPTAANGADMTETSHG